MAPHSGSLGAWIRIGSVLFALCVVAACANQTGAPQSRGAMRARSADPLATITDIAAASDIASYSWKNRGVAKVGYVKGIALSYGRAHCRLRAEDSDTVEIAKADTGDDTRDAISWYAPEFAAVGMDNRNDGADTLRHVFVLLIGLGMRESSGIYCTGRDQSASNTSAETAEAGLFQTSFNARSANAAMSNLFDWYQEHPAGFLDVYREGVPACSAADLQNFGSGDGAEFQRLSKESPDFAAQFTAVGLRNIRRHWGPINKKTAELKTEADTMLQQVEQAIEADPSELCRELL
jgi:hypothetical protein